MPKYAVRLSAGAFLLAAIGLAGCSSAGTDAIAPTASPAPLALAAEEPAAEKPAAQEAAGQEAAGQQTPAGGDCGVDSAGARAIVVQGQVDCGTLNEVWTGAVANPNFATHGNRNTIEVGDWTCRAHAVSPIPTGFCEDAGYRNKFKVVRTG